MRAAAIGTSVGVGVTGTLLLSLWQLQEQLNRSTDARQAEISKLLDDSSRELLEVSGSCKRVGAHTLGHVEQLRALDGSEALSPAEQITVKRLLDRLNEQCTGNAATIAACAETERQHQKDLCEVAQKNIGSGSALNYWQPLPRPPDAIHNLAQAWALLRGREQSASVAAAPAASVSTPAPAPTATST